MDHLAKFRPHNYSSRLLIYIKLVQQIANDGSYFYFVLVILNVLYETLDVEEVFSKLFPSVITRIAHDRIKSHRLTYVRNEERMPILWVSMLMIIIEECLLVLASVNLQLWSVTLDPNEDLVFKYILVGQYVLISQFLIYIEPSSLKDG